MRRNTEKLQTEVVKEIAAVLASINNLNTMQDFLSEIFTAAEYSDISLRWRLMQMLKSGMTQREIASKLGISLCKITRGAKILKKKGSVSALLLSGCRQ